MTACGMPLATASFLKSSSQVSNVPVPQAAANAGAAEIVSSALSASALGEKLGFISQAAPRSTQSRHLSAQTQLMFGQPRPKQGCNGPSLSQTVVMLHASFMASQ